MTTGYQAFLATKQRRHTDSGITVDPDDLHPSLFAFQRDLGEELADVIIAATTAAYLAGIYLEPVLADRWDEVRAR